MPTMFDAAIIIIIIIILITIIISFLLSLFCFAQWDHWEFAKPFVPTAFFINIRSLTRIILDIKLLLGYLWIK